MKKLIPILIFLILLFSTSCLALTITKGTAEDGVLKPNAADANGYDSTLDRFYIIPDSNSEVDITFEAAENGRTDSVALYGFPYAYGTANTSIIKTWLECEDSAASSAVVNSVSGGSNAIFRVVDSTQRNTNTSGDSINAYVDKGFDLGNGQTHIDVSTSDYTVSFLQKGSIVISTTANYNYDTGSNQYLFDTVNTGGTSSDRVQFYYSQSIDKFSMTVTWGGSATTVITDAYTTGSPLGDIVFHLFWNSDYDLFGFILDGVVYTGYSTSAPAGDGTLSYVRVGSYGASNYGDYTADNVKVFDEALIPYGIGGATLIGEYGASWAVATHPDSRILTYWDCSSTTVQILDGAGGTATIGTGATYETGLNGNGIEIDAVTSGTSLPITDGAGINKDSGVISFWYQATGTPDQYATLFRHSYSANSARLYRNLSDTELVLGMGNDTAVFTGVKDIFDGGCHFIEIRYGTNSRKLYIDGNLEGTDTDSYTPETMSSGVMYIGSNDGILECGGTIDEFMIVSDETVDPLWYVIGEGPLRVPIWSQN